MEKVVGATAKDAGVLFKLAALLDPLSGLDANCDLLVRDGVISEIGNEIPAPDGVEVVECEGLLLLPAFVDPHVHLRTPGREDEEDIASGTAAAAAGGFCAVLAMPNTDPTVDDPAVLASLVARAAREAQVKVGFLASITRGLRGERLTEMAELAQVGAVGFTDDGVPVADARIMRQAFQYQAVAGKVIALHEEDPGLSGSGVMHEGEVSAQLGLAGIPSVSESTQIERDCALAAYEGARCHILHLSCEQSVEALARAKAAGVAVTAEVTPHHLTLTDEAVRSLDSNFKMNPPLRTEADRQALIEGLRTGVIDCIASDHAPHSPEEKLEPFEQTPMGVTGLETAFSVLYTDLVAAGVLDLSTLVERMTAGAPIYDLERPAIEVGREANLALIDPEAGWQVGREGYVSRSRNSCFAGRELKGRVVMTVAGGGVAHRVQAHLEHRQRAGEGVL